MRRTELVFIDNSDGDESGLRAFSEATDSQMSEKGAKFGVDYLERACTGDLYCTSVCTVKSATAILVMHLFSRDRCKRRTQGERTDWRGVAMPSPGSLEGDFPADLARQPERLHRTSDVLENELPQERPS